MGLKFSRHAAATSGTLSLEEVARRPKLNASDVAGLPLVSHPTYARLAALAYADKQETVKCPEGWEVFLDCASLHLNREGYYAVAYVNRAMRHCVIAQRGTSEVLALRAGVWVYFEEPTIQFYLAEQFSRQVALAISLMQDPEEWVVSYTGHSLGAVLAACRAVEEDTLAVTFESPGSRAFLQKTGKVKHDSIDSCVIAYVRPPNPINTLKPHSGYMVMLPHTNADGSVATGNDGVLRTGGATSLMILPPASDAPPELAARSPIMPELPPAADESRDPAASAGRQKDNAATTAGTAARKAAATSTSPGTGGTPAAVSKTPAAPSRFSPSRLKLPSIRPQGYLREYVLGSVGFGIPELQQYVSKVEPMLREMLERTEQLHSINGILAHFVRRESGAAAAQEMAVVRWPTHLMQFMEYYNTVRALEDPDNQSVHVNAAYKAMMQRIFHVQPRPVDRIPLRYINAHSQKMVQLWWSWDAAHRKALPLSVLEHKALNCITIDGSELRVTVLDPFEAKQFLAVLVSRPSIASLLKDVWQVDEGRGVGSTTPTTITTPIVTSKL